MGLPAILAAAGPIIGGIGALGAGREASRASETNERIAQQNFEASQKAREEAIEFAMRLMEEERLGSTDEMGNRIHFDPERGWVSTLAPQQQQIADSVEREQQRQGTEGAIRAEGAERRMSELGSEAGQRADAAGREFDRVQRQDEGDVADLLFSQGQEAHNASQDRIAQAINRAMVRGGNTSNYGDMVSGRASNDASAARSAAVDSRLKAADYVENDYQSRRQGASGLQDAFTQRAAFSPQFSMTSPTSSPVQGSRQGSQNLFAAYQGSTPQQDYITPNYGMSNAMANIGSSIGGYGTYLQGRQDTSKLLEALQQRGGMGL